MVKPQLLRYEDAAESLGISFRTLKRAVANGQIKAILAPGTTGPKGMRISVGEISRYIRHAEQTPPSMEQWPRIRARTEKKRKRETG